MFFLTEEKKTKILQKLKKSTSNIGDQNSLAQDAIDIAFRIYFYTKEAMEMLYFNISFITLFPKYLFKSNKY